MKGHIEECMAKIHIQNVSVAIKGRVAATSLEKVRLSTLANIMHKELEVVNSKDTKYPKFLDENVRSQDEHQ